MVQIAVEKGMADDKRDEQRRALCRAKLVVVNHLRHSHDPKEMEGLALEDAAVSKRRKRRFSRAMGLVYVLACIVEGTFRHFSPLFAILAPLCVCRSAGVPQ